MNDFAQTSPATPLFSSRARNLQSSPIRDILAVLERPGMISFAGGLPNHETFPELSLDTLPLTALQYGASEGDTALRQQVALDAQKLGLPCDASQVLILSGSQQGIDLVAKLFIDPGTPVAVESPTYLAALQVFRFFGARLTDVPSLLNDGSRAKDKPALVYAIPTFQNPTGHCYNLAERQALARACDEAGAVLFEDDPYRDLVYDEVERRPVCSMLARSAWIYQGSFSKSLAPGLRLGFLIASPELMPYLVRLKQAADLHSSRLSQHLVLQQLRDPQRDARIHYLQDHYRRQRDHFEHTLRLHFADLADWQIPAGGLFFWLKLKAALDTRQLLPLALAQNIAFMPGEHFFSQPSQGLGCLRLNFSHASAAEVNLGLQRLAALIKASSPA
jgi:2-aminoadipate transaminase